MKRPVISVMALFALFSVAAVGPVSGQESDDLFDFIPAGGRTLLDTIQKDGLPPDLAIKMTETVTDPAVWRSLLDAAQPENPSLAALDDFQLDTLAHYLAANAPLDPGGTLPSDGRDIALERCQSCHIITVVITQSRTREAWLRTQNSPSHTEIDTTAGQREALADYLVINAGIPIDLVPPALRAGGASY